MAITPRLLTSECSAHYPRLWHLIEQSSSNKDIRKYPILLDMINFCQEFENWLLVTTEHMGMVLNQELPTHAHEPKYGSSPIIELRLEWFADNIGRFLVRQEEIATQMLFDLSDWHEAILYRTRPEALPKHAARRRCPECQEYAVMQYGQDFFCVNRNCEHTWVGK